MPYSDADLPDGLHGEGDEAGDGVGQGQVEHDVVNISPRSENHPTAMIPAGLPHLSKGLLFLVLVFMRTQLLATIPTETSWTTVRRKR